jgi:hypothetical protein
MYYVVKKRKKGGEKKKKKALVLPFAKYKFQLQFFKSKWDNIFL